MHSEFTLNCKKGLSAKTGFTLAEVLITLVIIGVIAALTVPSLIQRTNKQEYVTALKKAYSTLAQASQMIIEEEGMPSDENNWGDTPKKLHDIFVPHLNILKDCGEGFGCVPNIESYKHLNGAKSGELTGSQSPNYYSVVLADGTFVMFHHYYQIVVDINGSKKPNQNGRDVFYLAATPQKYNGFCTKWTDCASWGVGCSCRVLSEGAMNY